MSRFVWLRRFEVGRNSADINGLLDRLEFLQGFDLPSDLLETVPVHRIARLRRQGERYCTDELRDITGDRRLAILAVSPSSPSVPWNGAALSPMPWSRPMTGSSARPSGVRSGAAMRAFRIRGQYCTILWPPSGPLQRRFSRQKGTARAA